MRTTLLQGANVLEQNSPTEIKDEKIPSDSTDFANESWESFVFDYPKKRPSDSISHEEVRKYIKDLHNNLHISASISYS